MADPTSAHKDWLTSHPDFPVCGDTYYFLDDFLLEAPLIVGNIDLNPHHPCFWLVEKDDPTKGLTLDMHRPHAWTRNTTKVLERAKDEYWRVVENAASSLNSVKERHKELNSR